MSVIALQSQTRPSSSPGSKANHYGNLPPGSPRIPEKCIGRQAHVTLEPTTLPLSLVLGCSEDETPWQGQLLLTKCLVPPPPYALIPRHQLMKLLDDAMARPLTLVSAPAGFGKTTLLSAWAKVQQSHQVAVAWLSLTEEDNGLARFWTYALAALNKAQPGMYADLVALSQQLLSSLLPALLTTLINRLAQSSRPILLILDDYQVITEQAIHSGLFSLLEHLPPQVHVMLSTRVDPPMRLARLRAHGQMLEVRAEQLRCCEAEAADFFRAVIWALLGR